MITVLSTRANHPAARGLIQLIALNWEAAVQWAMSTVTTHGGALHGSRLWWSGIVNGFSFFLYISTKWASQPIRLITVLVTYVLRTNSYTHTGEELIPGIGLINLCTTHSFPARFLRVPCGRKDWLCLLITASNSHIWRWDIPLCPRADCNTSRNSTQFGRNYVAKMKYAVIAAAHVCYIPPH